MRARVSPSKRGVAALLALLVGLTLAPPCAAGDASPAPAPSGAPSLRAAAEARVAAFDARRTVRFAQESAPAASESRPFFKSRRGVLAVLLMAGGVAWAVVSRSQDAVHSPAR